MGLSHTVSEINGDFGRREFPLEFCNGDSAQKTSCACGDTICPAPLLPCRAPPSRSNVAVLSHAKYVPTLTAAAALRAKAALSKAAW